MYDVASEQRSERAVAPKREAFIRIAVERLEKLTAQSDELTERLKSTFSSVLFHQPPRNGVCTPDVSPMPGSDLGQALMRLAERLDRNFTEIKAIIESADIYGFVRLN